MINYNLDWLQVYVANAYCLHNDAPDEAIGFKNCLGTVHLSPHIIICTFNHVYSAQGHHNFLSLHKFTGLLVVNAYKLIYNANQSSHQ